MISVILAEIELGDDFNLGIRLSSSDNIASLANPDFAVTGGGAFTASEDQVFGSLFDTSVLDVNFDINFALQALAQETNLRVIQQPVIFTADNQEAFFFDGQDIPFITQTTINSQGNPTDSFEYREVGVILNVRPRITVKRDVDMELSLELSSVVPGQTLFGGAIIDKRETSTHVIVENGQTIVLSGILREEESTIVRKVPFFGDIPLLGELFKSRENSTTTAELLAFITPRVVDNPHEMDDAAFQQEFRQRLEDMNKTLNEQADEIRGDIDRQGIHKRFDPDRFDDQITEPADTGYQPPLLDEDLENGNDSEQ
jgi:general secretion pathway protein D